MLDPSFPIKIGRMEYNTVMLCDKDYADMVGYFQSRYIASATKALPLVNEQTVKREILSVAIRDSNNITWGCPEAESLLWSREGILQLGWMMCRKRHPKLTIEQFTQESGANDEVEPGESNIKLAKSIHEIVIAYEKLHYPMLKEDDSKNNKVGDAGGSSTVSDKSNQGNNIPEVGGKI